MDNIVDFTKRRQQMKDDADKPIPLEDYALSMQSLIMDPALQVDVLLRFAADKFMAGDLEAAKIHRLLECLRYIYDGFMPVFDITTNVIVRQSPGVDTLTTYSVYCYGMNMGKLPVAGVGVKSSPSYRLEIQLLKFDDDIIIDKGTIYPEDWLEFTFAEHDYLTKRTPKHFIKQMNNLVRINGGQGTLGADGYLAVIPYGNNHGIMISLLLDNPITLIPEEQRK